MYCWWCSPDESLLLPWILWLYKTLCARAFTGNEKPGSSWLPPFISRLSTISNSQGRGDASIKYTLNSFSTFFSLFRIGLFGYPFSYWHIIRFIELWIIQTWKIFFQQFQKPCTMWWHERLYASINAAYFFLKNVCSNELFIWLMYIVWNLSLLICVERSFFTLVCTIIFHSLWCSGSVMKLCRVNFW